MAECELLEGCLFFNEKMADMPATVELMKKNFCLDDNSTCARYVVFKSLGREKVPSDLFPNQLEQAKMIISAV